MKFRFIINVWGEDYIEDFKNFFITSFLNSKKIKEINDYLNNSEFTILTDDAGLSKLENSKEIINLNNIIRVNIINMTKIIKLREKKFTNQYDFLSSLQNISINASFKFDYLFFIYPDFIFSDDSLINIFELLNKNNYDIIFAPVPRLEKEKIEKLNIKNYLTNFKLASLVNNSIHYFDTNTFIDKDPFYSLHMMISRHENSWLFRNFHSHPIVLKNLNSEKYYLPFSPSLDESFVNIYEDRNIYVPKSSKEMLFCSLLEKNKMNGKLAKFDKFWFFDWANKHLNQMHVKIFNSEYFLEFTDTNDNEKNLLSNKIEKFINNNCNEINMSKDLINSYFPYVKFDENIRHKKIKKLEIQYDIINYRKLIQKNQNVSIDDLKISNDSKSIIKKFFN